MGSTYVRYKTPREAVGKWLALDAHETNDNGWDTYYNPDQKEYWYKKADKLIAFIKKSGLF